MSAGDVLVAYGSKHGATAEIAERIGATLRDQGLTADVRPAAEVKSLDPYRAVVLGSAVYMKRWRGDARKLLPRAAGQAAHRPLWLFSSGNLDRKEHSPESLAPRGVLRAATKRGVGGHAVFGGRLPVEPSNFMERAMVKAAPEGERDFRDWDAIEKWAREIARSLGRGGANGT
jgi:menaquinone-dependent protoporphyrinogen oxidase